MLDVWTFRDADCGTHHCLVIAEGGGGRGGGEQKCDMDRPVLKKMSECKILCMFGALENLDDNRNISQAWQNNRGNIRTSAKECLGHYE